MGAFGAVTGPWGALGGAQGGGVGGSPATGRAVTGGIVESMALVPAMATPLGAQVGMSQQIPAQRHGHYGAKP